jgi:hypothetical protein
MRPFTYEDVKEAVRTLGKNDTLELIGKFGVDFELNEEMAKQLKELGASEAILNLVRTSFRPRLSSLEIQCNTPCEAFIDSRRVGGTPEKSLVQPGLKPGKYLLVVQAPGFENETREIALKAGESSIQQFQLKNLAERFGTLDLTCGPRECDVSLNGLSRGTTEQNRLIIKDLAPGSYELESRSTGYRSKVQKILVSAAKSTVIEMSLEAEPPAAPAKSLTADEVMVSVLKALGTDSAQQQGGKFKSTGEMALTSSKIPLTTAHFVEYLWVPGKIRWDLQVAGIKWTVIENEQETFSYGDTKLRGSEFAGELEHNIGAFLNFHLSTILSSFRGSGIRANPGPPGSGLLMLVRESADDRDTLTVDSKYCPMRLFHEVLSGLQLKTEFLYGRYQSRGSQQLPFLLTIRYPDQAGYGHEIKYTSIEADPSIKEGLFKRSGFLRELKLKK